jgi:hypothetical protein
LLGRRGREKREGAEQDGTKARRRLGGWEAGRLGGKEEAGREAGREGGKKNTPSTAILRFTFILASIFTVELTPLRVSLSNGS